MQQQKNKMWNKKARVLGLIGILIIVLAGYYVYVQTKPQRQARQTIHAYMVAEGLTVRRNSEEYTAVMRGIIWGEYPELTNLELGYLQTQEELDAVQTYAWKHSGYAALYGKYDERPSQEAVLPEE